MLHIVSHDTRASFLIGQLEFLGHYSMCVASTSTHTGTGCRTGCQGCNHGRLSRQQKMVGLKAN